MYIASVEVVVCVAVVVADGLVVLVHGQLELLQVVVRQAQVLVIE